MLYLATIIYAERSDEMVDIFNTDDSPGTRMLKFHEAWKLVDAQGQTKTKSRKTTISPKHYDKDRQALKVGHYEVSYKTSSQASAILDIVLTARNLKKSWTFAKFLDHYKARLEADKITTVSQVRTAVRTINDITARQTNHTYFDIFIIDKGFGVNPKYLPTKQK